MDVYLSPLRDDKHQSDMERLGAYKVLPIVLGFKERLTVADAVRHLCAEDCTTLVMPDDFARHNEPMRHAKECAHHLGLKVMPVTHYLEKMKPAPATASVHAHAVAAGVG